MPRLDAATSCSEGRQAKRPVFSTSPSGGKNPSADNKHSTTTSGETTGNFTADKNGNVIGSLFVATAADTVGCPPGQTDVLVSDVWSNLTLKDLTSGATITLSNVSYVNQDAPPIR